MSPSFGIDLFYDLGKSLTTLGLTFFSYKMGVVVLHGFLGLAALVNTERNMHSTYIKRSCLD